MGHSIREADQIIERFGSHIMDHLIQEGLKSPDGLWAYLDSWSESPERHVCVRCGWWVEVLRETNTPPPKTAAAVMIEFGINDDKLALAEIRSHLARNFSDVYSLSSHRFEEVVGDIYRELGWNVRVTKRTRDGGADLVCVESSTGHHLIVECKRYSVNRRVEVDRVRSLLGAKVLSGSHSAHLVTTGHFTRDAVKTASQAQDLGIELDLIDADELFRILQVYSDPMLTVKDLSAIFSSPDL